MKKIPLTAKKKQTVPPIPTKTMCPKCSKMAYAIPGKGGAYLCLGCGLKFSRKTA